MKQRKEFRKCSLIKDNRDLVTEEIGYNMFPAAEMNTLDDEIELSSFSVHDYIAIHIQQVFLPWPLSLLHLLPDWVILSGLLIIGLILIKIFLDPCMAICHLLRDSSLTITEYISTAVIPATTVTILNRKENMDLEEGRHDKEMALEARVIEIEKRLNMFQTIVLREKVRDEGSIRCIEN